jgi:hypothetical protein
MTLFTIIFYPHFDDIHVHDRSQKLHECVWLELLVLVVLLFFESVALLLVLQILEIDSLSKERPCVVVDVEANRIAN